MAQKKLSMLELVYISTATRSFEQDDLRELVEQAAAINSREGITGLLLYNGRNFLQLLEGESGRIVALMARLRADPRHDGIRIVSQRRTAAPACGGWGMRLVPLDRELAQRKADLGAILPDGLSSELRQLIVNFAGLA